MMYATKPNAVIYVTRAGLAIAGKKIQSARLPLPPEVVSNLEVVNVERFTTECQQFFTNHGLKGKRVLVVLGLSVVFEKSILLDKTGNPSALTKTFVAAMPFEPGQRACVTVDTDNQHRIYATNALLYQPLIEALEFSKAKVMAITPAPAYHLTGTDRSFEALAAQFMQDTKVSGRINFQDAEVY
jgi:hypothetical protein